MAGNFAYDAIEQHEGRTGSPFMSDMHREYSLVFKVVTTNKLLGSNAVCRCPGVPSPFSPYVLPDGEEFDLAARAVKHTATKADPDDPFVWFVRVDYSTKMPPGGPVDLVGMGWDSWGAQNNPELIPPVIYWDSETANVSRPYDLDKKAFVNSADQPFSPAYTTETDRCVLVLVRNELDFGPERALKYSSSTNSDQFLKIGDPGTVKCKTPTAQEDWIGEIRFWRVTYRLVFNYPKFRETLNISPISPSRGPLSVGPSRVKLETWQPQFLDQGVVAKAAIGPIAGIPVPIIRHGVPITAPVLLNGTGGIQNEKDADGNLIPVWISRRTLHARSYTTLLRGTTGRL